MNIKKELDELKQVLSSPALAKYIKADIAREARNEKRANWLDSFAERFYSTMVMTDSPNLVNEKTGKIHTVESMVEELRERVKLDTLKKSATENHESPQVPLTAFEIYASAKKKEYELKQSIENFISSFISSHRGYVSEPGVLFALRDNFDNTELLSIDSWVKRTIADAVKAAEQTRTIDTSVSSGAPLKMDMGEDSIQPLFPNIKNV